MKMNAMVIFQLFLATVLLNTGASALGLKSGPPGATYGPGDCIGLSRSSAGSCVIKTNCQGQDTSKTEFAFNCAMEKMLTRHSYGIGGFEANEEFDTEVRCERCERPASAASLMKHLPAPTEKVLNELAKLDKEASTDASPRTIERPLQRRRGHRHSQHAGKHQGVHHHVVHHKHSKRGANPGKTSRRHLRSRNTEIDEAPQDQQPQHQMPSMSDVMGLKTRMLEAEKAREEKAPNSAVLKARLEEAARTLEQDKARVVSLKSELAAAEAPKPQETSPQASAGKEQGDKVIGNDDVEPVHFTAFSSKFWPFTSKTPQKKKKVIKYGPKDCVSVWRNEEGHCVMRTECKGVDIKSYTFGLICIEKTGTTTRHVFGKDSFDEEETFDTLVTCEKCLSFDYDRAKDGDKLSPIAKVKALKQDIQELTSMAKDLSGSVEKLNAQVFPKPKKDKKADMVPSPAPAKPSFVQDDEEDDDNEDDDTEGFA
jgi:hypothetical protein